jgi:hypothetical protein
MPARDFYKWAVAPAAAAGLTLSFTLLRAEDPAAAKPNNPAAASGGHAAVEIQQLSDVAKRGLAYLVAQQQPGGGWGQGGGWRQNGQGSGRVEGENVNDPPDLGNTCAAALALVRAGNTPTQGPYAQNLAKAASIVCDWVERADDDTLFVTNQRDTQLQSKIGRYVDTFLAGLVLSELKGKMPADGSDKRVLAALEKTIRKIEKHQGNDGNFAGNTGWASVLSQGLATKCINRAAQNDVAVRREVLERDFNGSVAAVDVRKGEFTAKVAKVEPSALSSRISGRVLVPTESAAAPALATSAPSDAGVSLYYSASNAGRLSDLGNTSTVLEKRAKELLSLKTATAEQKAEAEVTLKQAGQARDAQEAAVRAICKQLDDKGFIAGFGNNGGEEFLSYMNISEMLAVKGGPEWNKWNQNISGNLARVQNQDGSWSGQHCITGRTFCTATALLTLLADRAPVPKAEPKN